MQKYYALITGASSGLGLEFAKQLASENKDLVLVARRSEVLQKIKLDLQKSSSSRIEVISLDLSKESAGTELFDVCLKQNLTIDLIINNAGSGKLKSLTDHSAQEITEMICLNATTPTLVTRHFLRHWQNEKQDHGSIINVASTAAFQAIPSFSVYAATKAFLLHMTEAVHTELRSTPYRVFALCPGPTHTEFMMNAEVGNNQFKAPFQSAREVVKFTLDHRTTAGAFIIPGLFNRIGAILSQLSPRSMVVRLAGEMIGKPDKSSVSK